MTAITRRNRLSSRGLVIALIALASPVWSQDAEPVSRAMAAMRAAAGAELSITRSPRSGLATFVSAPPGRSIPAPDATASTPASRALSFVAAYGAAFGLRGRDDVSIARVQRDDLGIDHVRMRQVRSGLPVTGGELIVHLRGDRILSANGRTLDQLDQVSLQATIASSAAAETARQLLRRGLNAEAADLSDPRLEIFNQGLLGGREFPTRLAWFIEARALGLREFVWIDARSGIALLHFSQLAEAKNRAIYNANNGLPGSLIRSEGGVATGDADADLAYDYSGDTYDYFFTNHGRDSFDGAGAQIISSVHYCPSPGQCPYGNAFWDGTQMVYGNGFSSADDVVAHELTHAVTERTANLFYYMQSGALNESFSDIFGETVDLLNGAGNDTPGVRWQLGEDLTGIGAIRNMMTPTLFGDPGKMSDPQFACELDPIAQDAGGVHGNSGVPNHAYALMVDGGTYNSITVSGIGLAKAGKIQYRVLTQYLTSASDFLDDYTALQQACLDLVGIAGIAASDCSEVTKAVNAVQLANPWPCSTTYGFSVAAPALCSAGQHVVNTFYDDFESGFSNWTVTGPTFGPAGTWFSTTSEWGTSFATSGLESLWGYDQPGTSDSSVELASNLSIPSGARLQFNHSYGFENGPVTNWDGGRVEYSTNGGASWSDLSGLFAAGANYGGTISTLDTNPLAGLPAFVKDSFGYTASQYNLSSLAGQSQFRFRFRIGSDSSVNDYGWFIDDVRVYTCAQDPPVVTTTSATGIGQTSAALNGSVNPNGAGTTALFQYGLTTSYGSQVASAAPPGSGLAVVPISASVSGLACNTTYHVRAVATNSGGTSTGNDVTFQTAAACPPVVATSAAANVSTTTADLAGNVTSDSGFAISQRGFVFSEVLTNPDPLMGGPGVTTVPVAGATGPYSSTLSSLTPSTGYVFKAYATNTVGTAYTAAVTFTTSDPPAPEALGARTLAANSASETTISNVLPQAWYRARLFAHRAYQISAWPVEHEQGIAAATLSVSLFSDDAGTVQANGVSGGSEALEATANQAGDSRPFTAVIRPAVTGVYKIRVKATSGGAAHTVNVLLRETTLFSPWTSRAAGYEGFIEMHNNTGALLSVTLRAFNNAGVQQGPGLSLTLPPNATDYRTATQIGVPVNVFAGIVLTHEGGFGAVSANITTLNGTTGLSFDSPFGPRDPSLQASPVR